MYSTISLGNLCTGWCPIYSPKSLLDVSFTPLTRILWSTAVKFPQNLRIGGNAVRFFRIWYQSHSAAFFCVRKVDFVSADSWCQIALSFGESENWFHCVCSRLLKKTVKHYANFCSLITKSIAYMETKLEKLLRRSLFAVAGFWDYKTMLLLLTPMAVLQLYVGITQQVSNFTTINMRWSYLV